MEVLLILLIALIGLAAFDFAAVESGFDSRWSPEDQHAPRVGAR